MEPVHTTHFALLHKEAKKVDFAKILPQDKHIGLFTENYLQQLIEEEVKHQKPVVKANQTLRSMSSGERKIALVNHLISQKPEVLYIEDLQENLDPENKNKIIQQLHKLATGTQVIQVVKKEKELLPFIKNLFYLDKENQLTSYAEPIARFFQEKKIEYFNVPETTTIYRYNYTTFIKLKNVSVQYLDNPILKDISWEIKPGEFWQLVGENGSGKTTLLSLITGDNPKAYGQDIVLFDKPKGTEDNVWQIKHKIGYFTPNITELFSKRHSVLDMVLSGFYDSVGLYVKPQDIHISLAQRWLKLAEMEDLAQTTFTTLSPSQQRIIMIIRAMVKHPPLLILDEPTSGVDREGTAIIVALINKIAQETPTTIIYVSHVLEQGLSPNYVYRLKKGNLGSVGKVI